MAQFTGEMLQHPGLPWSTDGRGNYSYSSKTINNFNRQPRACYSFPCNLELAGPRASWLSQENQLWVNISSRIGAFPECPVFPLNWDWCLGDSWRWLCLCQAHFTPCEPAPCLGHSRLWRCALMAPCAPGAGSQRHLLPKYWQGAFPFLLVTDHEHFVGVQGSVRFVSLMTISSTAPIILDLTNRC